MSTVTALATTDRRTDVAAFEPASIDEALSVSKLLVASRLLPRSITTPEAAFAVIVTGRELGLSAMQALRAVHIVEGKPTLSADLMVALVKRSDACLFFRLVESSAAVAVYETHRRGEPGATRMSWTIAEAQAAGVTGKDNWRKYPAAMLRARCAAALARAVYPDLVLGVYDPDELAAPIDVTPVPQPVAPPAAPPPPPAAAKVSRASKAAPPPPPPPPAEEIVEAEVVEPVAASGVLARVQAEITQAADLAAGRKALEAARSVLDDVELVSAFGTLLGRCSTAAEANTAATVVVDWKKAGAISESTVEALRLAFRARKDALSQEVV